MNNTVLGKTMGSVRKHWDIKLATVEKRKNYTVSKPNYHKTKFFSKSLLETEMKKEHKYS